MFPAVYVVIPLSPILFPFSVFLVILLALPFGLHIIFGISTKQQNEEQHSRNPARKRFVRGTRYEVFGHRAILPFKQLLEYTNSVIHYSLVSVVSWRKTVISSLIRELCSLKARYEYLPQARRVQSFNLRSSAARFCRGCVPIVLFLPKNQSSDYL